MYNLEVITKETIKEIDYQKIYNWRFESYGNCFTTTTKPTYESHKKYLDRQFMCEYIEWYGLRDNNELIACCSVEKKDDRSESMNYELGRVMVDPKRKREGIASLLISKCIVKVKRSARKCRLKLEVLKSNRAAIQLYLKLGFRFISEDSKVINMERKLDA